MKVETNIQGNKVTVSLEGDLIGDQHGIELLTIINNLLDKNFLDLEIDFSDLRYMNSTGLGVLITLYTKVKRVKGSLKLININEQIVRLFEITQLDKIFEIQAK